MTENTTGERAGSGIDSTAWMSACFQPWTVIEEWSMFWTRQWMHWLEAVTAAPNPWLPTVPVDQQGESLDLGLFLPWLPRIEASVMPVETAGDRDAMRVRLRAAMSNTMTGEHAEWLNVDATVSRSGVPASAEEVPPPELKAPNGRIIDVAAGRAAETPAAPKPRTRRTRAANKPGAAE